MGKYLYSAATGGVYLKGFHDEIPPDALSIADELYRDLFAQPLPAGKVVGPSAEGVPQMVDGPGLSEEALAASERAWRDNNLLHTDNLVARHRDEQEQSIPTTLSSEQYVELQVFRSRLRSWPEGKEFPLAEHRPVIPSWMLETLQ
ncbi:phage tail protein [Pseudomonas monsensis]